MNVRSKADQLTSRFAERVLLGTNKGVAMPPRTPQPAQLARLRQLLAWMIPFDFSFALLAGVAFAVFRDIPTGTTAIVMLCYGFILLVARAQVVQGALHTAIAMICTGLLGADILIAAAQPFLLPALTFVPLLAVTVALPYISGASLRRLIGISWLVIVIVTLLGEFLTPPNNLPFWYSTTFRIGSLAATASLVLLLLWQFSSRLTETLAQTRAAEERYSLAALGANDGLWDWDLASNQMYFSPRWKQMLGAADEQIGTSPDEWFNRIHPEERARVSAEIANHQDGLTQHFESEHRVMDINGRYRWILSRGLAVFDATGKATRMAGSQTDITNRKQTEERLLHDAFHDVLTGLANRALLMDRLNRAVTRSKRHPDYLFAVLFLDLDRFKNINDSLGHTVGDKLLVALARRFQTCLRPNDTVARLGGDEFAILLDGVTDLNFATLVASRLQTTLETPFDLDGSEVFVATSIGIALSASDYEQAEEILRDADIALYRAKALGRSRYEVFSRVMHTRAVELLQLEMDLRRAVDRQEFLVYYQPIVSLKSEYIAGFEALVRWQHPQRGLMTPAEFLHVAEETGLIVPMGWWVLREACRQLRMWQAHFPEYPPLTLSINFSANQFAHPDLRNQLDLIFREIATDTRQLRFEVTETVMMENVAAAHILDYLRDLNIQLDIDDFGTGYSSLSTLHHFPINALKIDRSFVARVGNNGENGEVIQAIVGMAHNLQMEVIAEGVETSEQCEILRNLGCDYAQGNLFSQPIDGKAAGALMSKQAW